MGLVEKIKEIGKSNLMNYVIKPAFEYVILPMAIIIGTNEFVNAQEKWIDVWPGENLAKVTKLYEGNPDIRYRLHEGEYITQYMDGQNKETARIDSGQELYGIISFVNPPDIMTNQVGLDIDKEKSTILKGAVIVGNQKTTGAKIYNVCLTDIDINDPYNNSEIQLLDDNCLAENLYVFSGVAQIRSVRYNSKINNCVINDVNITGINTDTADSNTTITNSLFKHINGNAIRIPQTAVSLYTTADDGCIFRDFGAVQTNIYNSSMSNVGAKYADWGLDDIFNTPAGIEPTIINVGAGSTTSYSPWASAGSKLYIPINYGQVGPTAVSDGVWNAYWNIY